jgi:hypothetical protein
MDRNDAIATACAALKPAVDAGVFSGHPTRLKRFLLKFSMTSLAHDARTWDETAFRYDDERGGPVVTKANAGDAEADAVLREIATAQLQEGLPRNLAAYVRNVLAGQNPPDSRGRPRNFDRDIIIHYVVKKIRGLGFEATRNEASKTDSACTIVNRIRCAHVREERRANLAGGSAQYSSNAQSCRPHRASSNIRTTPVLS